MDSKTKWFVIGLLSFTLGSIVLAAYFLTPNSGDDHRAIKHGLYSFSEKHYAFILGLSQMVCGCVILLLTSCNKCDRE